MNQKLLFARAYEREASRQIPEMARPKFHLSPCTGWMNDPNGFSFYKGEYHLFYQYNPYDTCWDTMHWGHAVSGDLLSWRYLPAAMAPNEWYDADGCWSGSAMEMPDGRQLLMYTGNRRESGATRENLQVQCLALGDGIDYEKYAGNPVLTAADLPDECSPYDFRDPSIWRESDGTYRAIVGTCTKERLGKLLLFSSEDGLRWRFESVFAENDGRLGLMWECPDFFMLDGKAVLLVSPQDMLPQDFEYHNGNGTVAFIGHLEDDGKRFVPETDHAVDYGIDFYAPTTILTPDGRRVMIGWMQNWDACQNAGRKDLLWYGQMSLPRELFLRSGRLYQRPIRELEEHRSHRVSYENVRVDGELRLPGVEGRMVDMEITIRPAPGCVYHKFEIRFMEDERFFTKLSYRPHESILRIDRKFSGSRRAYIHQRRALVPNRGGELKLRMILDRYSVEVFLNDGEQTVTATVLTDLSATGISFLAEGQVEMDIDKYDLFQEVSREKV